MQKETIGIIDLGTKEQKEKLYQFKELVNAPASVSLVNTDPTKWKIYPRRNQLSQSSCVYHARAKCAGILQEMQTGEFVEYSATGYNERSNAPLDGAYPVESFDFWRNKGIGLEVLEQSNNISAQELEKHKQTIFEKEIAKTSLLDAYFALTAMNFDQVVSTIKATSKPIPMGFFATYNEWNRDVPEIQNTFLGISDAPVRHEVCATPNIGVYKGLEGFTVEDSWGTVGILGKGVRWITREFFERRNYIAGLVPTKFKSFTDMGIKPEKPRYKFTRDLEKGMTGDDVKALQEIYKYEGFFPANHSGSDYFGNITQDCTKKFQEKYNIVSSGDPQTTGYGRVGLKTRLKLNEIYK